MPTVFRPCRRGDRTSDPETDKRPHETISPKRPPHRDRPNRKSTGFAFPAPARPLADDRAGSSLRSASSVHFWYWASVSTDLICSSIFCPLLGTGTETPVRRPSRRLAGGTPRRLRHFLEMIEQNPLDLPGLLVRKRQLFGHALSHSLGPLFGSHLLSVRTLSREAPRREQQYGCRDGHSYDAFHTFSFLYRNCKNSSVTLRTSRENREPENSAHETPSGPRERLTQPRRETRCAPTGSNESGGNPPG